MAYLEEYYKMRRKLKDPKISPDKAKYIYYVYDTKTEQYLTKFVSSTRKHKTFYRACDAKNWWSAANERIDFNDLKDEAKVLVELGEGFNKKYKFNIKGVPFNYQKRYVLKKFSLEEVV